MLIRMRGISRHAILLSLDLCCHPGFQECSSPLCTSHCCTPERLRPSFWDLSLELLWACWCLNSCCSLTSTLSSQLPGRCAHAHTFIGWWQVSCHGAPVRSCLSAQHAWSYLVWDGPGDVFEGVPPHIHCHTQQLLGVCRLAAPPHLTPAPPPLLCCMFWVIAGGPARTHGIAMQRMCQDSQKLLADCVSACTLQAPAQELTKAVCHKCASMHTPSACAGAEQGSLS